MIMNINQTIRANAKKVLLIDFAMNHIDEIMQYLKCDTYAITGSIAMNLYGINRDIKDVDVIVPPMSFNIIKLMVRKNPMFEVLLESYPNSAIEHISFKTINSPTIDVISCKDYESAFINVPIHGNKFIRVVKLEKLIRAKQIMNRSKDIEDIKMLEALIDTKDKLPF